MNNIERQPWTACLGAVPAILLLFVFHAHADEPWTAPLQRGGQVEVDPRTNRPVLDQNGRRTQLWDGVHRLEDGSVIRIEGGRVVPTTDMLAPSGAPSEPAASDTEAPEAVEADEGEAKQPTGGRLTGASPCEQLVLRVCGAARTCWQEPACEAARQLRQMEQEEWLKGADPGRVTESGKQCEEAMSNAFFAPCR
ncbi:hypothetical protein [Thiocapsa marina]|uniref:Uncharacterized protein n=1 Tax=Thiocapsa marina 5811 TaxID=768671 RepID=F9UI54_9GAMM|nr:hypothetical protein [Thiocapsa marina]EGV16113.1 hypothetical protein ThimaDRAFT_4607 [Thiocapsa marina 5811]